MPGRNRYREIIHLLNRRYHQEFLRAERVNRSWFTRAVHWLKRRFRKSQSTVTFPIIDIEPVIPSGKVSIIIPFRNGMELLRDCIQSIRISTYRDYEVILVDNGSDDPKMKRYLEQAKNHRRYQVVHCPELFNFARLCNQGAKLAQGEYLLFLNNDTSVISEDWLEQMLVVVQQPQVGIVGSVLLYPDGTIQHGGLYEVHEGQWDHRFRYQSLATIQQEKLCQSPWQCPAVSAACLMISQALFEQLNGFDENFPLTHNDTDLCRRVLETTGQYTVVTPHSLLWHYESLTRGYTSDK